MVRNSSVFQSGGANSNQAHALTGFTFTGELTHLTYVFNVVPGAGNDTLTFYQDGVLIGTTPLRQSLTGTGTGPQIDWAFGDGPCPGLRLGPP